MKGNEKQQNKLKIIAIPLLFIWLIIFFVLTIIPAIITFIISFQRYNPQVGISGSHFVGLHNYHLLLQELRYQPLFTDSIVLAVVPAIIAIIIAFPVAFIVGGMQAGRLRSACIGLLLLPAFVPDRMLSNLLVGMVWREVIVGDHLYTFLLITKLSIKPAAICAFVGACAAGIYRDRGNNVALGAISGVLIGIAVNAVRFFSGNRELIAMTPRSCFAVFIDGGFDDWIFHFGINRMQLSAASAVWVFKTMLQFALAIILVIIVFLCVRMRKNELISSNIVNMNTSSIRTVFAFASALLFLLLLILPLGLRRDSAIAILLPIASSPPSPLTEVVQNLSITLASGVVFIILFTMITTWCYAYFGKIAFALILLLSPLVNNFTGEFIFYSNLSLLNNHLPVILSGIFSLSFVLPTVNLAHLKRSQVTNFGEYIRTIGPYLIAFTGVFVANTWKGYFAQMIYASSNVRYTFFRSSTDGWRMAVGTFDSIFLILFVLPVLFIGIGTVRIFTFIDSKAQGMTTS